MNPLRRALVRLLMRQELAAIARQVYAIAAEPASANRQRLGEQLAAQSPSIAPHIADFLRQVDEVYAPYSPEGRRRLAQHALSTTLPSKRMPR